MEKINSRKQCLSCPASLLCFVGVTEAHLNFDASGKVRSTVIWVMWEDRPVIDSYKLACKLDKETSLKCPAVRLHHKQSWED